MAKTVKMTEGNIAGQLLSYALPLIAGNGNGFRVRPVFFRAARSGRSGGGEGAS